MRLLKFQRQLAFVYRSLTDTKNSPSVFTVLFPEGNEDLRSMPHGFDRVSICLTADFDFRGRLSGIDTGDEFLEKGDKNNLIRAPRVSLNWKEEGFNLFLFSSAKKERPEIKGIGKNRVIVGYKTGNGLFEYNWREEKGFIILSQKHVRSKTTRILQVPLHVDTGKVEELLLTGLSVDTPWRKMDEIVGASVSYSYLLDSEIKPKAQR